MKKGYIRLLITCFSLISIFALNGFFSILNTDTLIFLLSLAVFGLYHYLGYEKANKRYTKDTFLTVLIYGIAYSIITNVAGVFIGFYKTQYSLAFLNILKNTLPIIVIIVLAEVIRYIIIAKGIRYRVIQALTVATFVLLDMTLFIGNYKEIKAEIATYLFIIILPAITTNIMLTYLTSKVGYRPAILYRALFILPTYLFPVFPNFGLYIEGMIKIISPAIFLCFLYYNFSKGQSGTEKPRQKFKLELISLISTCIILLFVFAFTSGWFKYYAITVATGSMQPNINKGDIIIVEKRNEQEMKELKEGEILVYKKDGKIIVHRIVKIVQFKNEYYFYTKGDYNEIEDGYPIETKDIIGTTSVKIPYLGYPTLWLNSIVK